MIQGPGKASDHQSGGEYPAGSEAAVFDLQTRYVELAFGFIGFKDIRSVIVEPTLQGGPELARARVAEAIDRVKKIAIDF